MTYDPRNPLAQRQGIHGQQLANLHQHYAAMHHSVIAQAAKTNLETHRMFGPDGVRHATHIFLSNGGDPSVLHEVAQHLNQQGYGQTAQVLHQSLPQQPVPGTRIGQGIPGMNVPQDLGDI